MRAGRTWQRIRPFFANGLVLDALEQPTVPLEAANRDREFVFTEVPPILIARLRRT